MTDQAHPRVLTTRDNKYRLWKDFTDDIQEAVNSILPTGLHKYKKIALLCLKWAESDIDVSTPEERFVKIARSIFNWEVEKFTIPVRTCPTQELTNIQIENRTQDAVRDFGLRHGADDQAHSYDTLLIYLYGGHAAVTGNRASLNWANRSQPPAKSFDWLSVSIALDRAYADKLLILDCCNAAIAGVQTQNLRCETLVACAVESTTTAAVGVSFTELLAETLEEAAVKTLSVGQLYTWIHNDFTNKAWSCTPIWIPVQNQDSVILHPIPRVFAREAANLNFETGKVSNKAHMTVSLECQVTEVPDREAWKKWLTTHVPPNIRDITINAKLVTSSCIIHMSMPPAVWIMLVTNKPNGPFTFVEYDAGPFNNRPGIAGGTGG